MTNPISMPSGSVVVTSPTSPPTKVVGPTTGSTVLTSPGRPGPPGAGVELRGAVATYEDLPVLSSSDAGASYVVQDNGLLYVWSGTAWPLEANGSPFKGDKGDTGRGVSDITLSSDDLLFSMTDNSTETVEIPAITAANASAVAAAASAGAASTSASDAAGSASDAETSADNASVSEGNANAFAVAADASADAAALSEGAAAASESSAATSAAAADVDRLAAEAAETNASNSETNAAASATTASGAASLAVTARDEAETASVNAQGYASDANDSADAAAQSAQDAADVVGSGVPDATDAVKGGILLPGGVGGELGGTYDHPTVTGWDDKADLVSGKIPAAQLPALAITETYVVADEATRLGLTAQTGDVAVQTSNPGRGTYILQGTDPSVASDWVLMSPPTDAVSSVNGYQGAVVLSKSDVGLGSANNTSDADKPVSTATQTALNGKANSSHNHSGGDITTGTVPYNRLPVGSVPDTVAAGNDPRMTNARTPVSHQHPVGDITGTMPFAQLPVGTGPSTVAAGNDSRLSDQRTPSDNSVTNAKVSASAAIALSKLATGYVQGSANGTATTMTVWTGTEAQYNAIGTKDSNTVYIVVG